MQRSSLYILAYVRCYIIIIYRVYFSNMCYFIHFKKVYCSDCYDTDTTHLSFVSIFTHLFCSFTSHIVLISFILQQLYIVQQYFEVHISGPALPLCVLQDFFIKPALCEFLALVHQLEQSEILLWVYMASQYVLWHAHL